MAKWPTSPDCFDEVRTITIACLRQLGYLKPGLIVRNASLRWTRGGEPDGSITLDVDATSEVMELRYDIKRPQDISARAIKCRVRLESRLSNLGKGRVWYFICPATGKRCRTLYGIGDYFLSRSAYPSAMYSSQTESKSTRALIKAYRILDLEQEFFAKPYARTTYKGKPTKRYQSLINRERRFDSPAIRRIFNNW